MLSRFICILIFGMIYFSGVLAWCADFETTVLAPGRSIFWRPARGAMITVSNGSIVGVRARQNFASEVQIVGKKIGSAVIRSGDKSLEVRVLSEKVFAIHQKLQAVMNEMRGLTLAVDEQNLLIKGRLLRWEDWLSLAHTVGATDVGIRFEATMDPVVAEQAMKGLLQILQDASLPELTLELQPNATVSLPMEPEDLLLRVRRVLGPFGFKIERSSAQLTLEPLVRVRIIVAELKTKNMSRIGVQWPAGVEAQILPDLQLPTGNQLTVGLNALEENGLGKVLASPTLLCRSGKEAQFLAGGEFPIKITNFKTNDVIWKRHGVLLKVRPRADDSGRMSIAIETEVSMIDSSQTVDGIPGLLTNRIETHFDLKSSRTIALSGLIKKEWGQARSGLPGLSSLPILGPLFSSEDYRENKSELVVFVTPEIARPDREGF